MYFSICSRGASILAIASRGRLFCDLEERRAATWHRMMGLIRSIFSWMFHQKSFPLLVFFCVWRICWSKNHGTTWAHIFDPIHPKKGLLPRWAPCWARCPRLTCSWARPETCVGCQPSVLPGVWKWGIQLKYEASQMGFKQHLGNIGFQPTKIKQNSVIENCSLQTLRLPCQILHILWHAQIPVYFFPLIFFKLSKSIIPKTLKT